MPTKPVRVAIYLRVSKDDGSQETDNQLIQLREFCGRWEGRELVAEYLDRESGTGGRRGREDFDRMFADARRRRFDVLLFWALDRFSHEGIRKTIAYLERLDACGVTFKSYTEPFLDTDNELLAHIVLGVTSYYAQQEALTTFLYQVHDDVLTEPSDVQTMFDSIPVAEKKLQWIYGTAAR